jgi:AraC family transcriptional regulator of adaptative response / DNA-3-methyladenine glycosylase II
MDLRRALDTQRKTDNCSAPFVPQNRAHLDEFKLEHALDPGICWQAIYSRDLRFDGRFFAAVTTTGLYCRNVCPVPFAQPKNVVLFARVAAAESAGFRPCKRCRPQATPETPAWRGTSAVTYRALRLILDGALHRGNIEQLAARLGIGPRQLRRLCMQHLGASPLKIAHAHRVQMAIALIEGSKLGMTEIAFRSGFQSIREFNHSLRLTIGQAPTELRRGGGAFHFPGRHGALEIRLPYIQPFDWESLLAFFRQRAIPGVESVTESSYQRTIENAGVSGLLKVSQAESRSWLVVNIEIGNFEALGNATERIRRMFDLSTNLRPIASHLSRDPGLRGVISLRPGLRLPGAWDGFEAAVVAILGQGLTSTGRRTLITRLVSEFGPGIDTPIPSLKYLFPRPEVLADADLSKTGMSVVCANAIQKLSLSTVRGQLNFATAKTSDETVLELKSVCGIDESTAHYIAMRAFGEPDAFPASDRGLRRGLADGKPIASSSSALSRAEDWRPWRSYAAMHLTQVSRQ